jgi:hypothetical protein
MYYVTIKKEIMNQSEIQLKTLDQTVKVGILACPGLFMADVVGVHTVFGA